MPAVDLADILEELDHDHRLALFNELDTDRASDALEEVDPSVQRSIVLSLDKNKVANLVSAMTPAQAADLLSTLPWSEVRRILNFLGHETVTKIRAILEHQEENILNLATTRFLNFSPEETVHDTAEAYRQRAKGMDVVMYLYILDAESRLLGVIDIKELLQASGDVLLKDIMIKNIVSLNPDSKLKEASELFERYGFRAVPITDANDKILGVIPYRDIMKLGHRFLE
jgi:Mg/Co/Ni transporter MgtE